MEVTLHVMSVAKNEMLGNITQPFNSGKKKYYSLLSNGSCSANTMDEKEVVLIKTCDDGRSIFHVIDLQVVEEGCSRGIANNLKQTDVTSIHYQTSCTP